MIAPSLRGDDVAEDKSASGTASAMVAEAQRLLGERLAEIGTHLDWREPRAAFYGETNAGKSALIETLRLLFDVHGDEPGLTIGNGSSDFTREAASYSCECRGKRFLLVDVPGIEGDEALVTEHINAAVDAAHLVFFVTAEPRAPQTGDNGVAGTIEKIARNLRAQTKVWAVYNKKVSRPAALGENLATRDELSSLSYGANSLDGRLREAIGWNYQGHVCVSALPAFLALATPPTQEWRFSRQREKFLAVIDADELLRLSRLRGLADVIAANIPSDREIFAANVGKLRPCVFDAADDLARRADQAFVVPAQSLRSKLPSLERDLSGIADDASRAVGRLADEITGASVKRIRSAVLEAIAAGLKDDEALRRRLDLAIDEERADVGRIVSLRLRSTTKRLRASCDEALHILANRLRRDEAFESTTFAASFKHVSKVSTRSGVDWVTLTGSALGLAIAAAGIASGGVFVAVVGALGSLAGIWNGIKFFMSSDFHKEQQRRALNANLDEIGPVVRADVAAALVAAETRLRADVLGVSERLRAILDELDEAWRRTHVAVAALRMTGGDDARLVAIIRADVLDSGAILDEHPVMAN